ncbi:hypothetical protein JR334_02035 [Clostridia bacterium]|nr:hypothetical protein JR334_02035 [Clostridia bacterium]
MEKVIEIDGRQIPFKSTGAYLIRYKQQFGRDAIQDLCKIDQAIKQETKESPAKVVDVDAFDMLIFYDMVWTLAKTADPDILPPMEWLDTFSTFPLTDHLGEWLEMIRSSFSTVVESKKKP